MEYILYIFNYNFMLNFSKSIFIITFKHVPIILSSNTEVYYLCIYNECNFQQIIILSDKSK
jgi:hypothetical protein